MAKVELKQPIVAEISENIKDAQSVVLVDYRGLTVEQDTNFVSCVVKRRNIQSLQEHNDELCIQGNTV